VVCRRAAPVRLVKATQRRGEVVETQGSASAPFHAMARRVCVREEVAQ
jgi:hypothetical protein